MFADLTKEIKAQLYERAKSPLFGAFALAWLAWNFWALVALFSDMSFAQKIAYWNLLYPTPLDQFISVFAGPVASAALFIWAYPIPARWAFHYWFGEHTKLKAIQQKIEDETPITQQEANDLRKSLLEKELIWQKQLSDASKTSTELRQQVERLMTELNDARQEIAKSQTLDQTWPVEAPHPLDNIVTPVPLTPVPFTSTTLKDPEPRAALISFPDTDTSNVTVERLISSLPETTKNLLEASPLASDDRVLGTFLALVRRSGYMSKGDLATFPDLSPIDMRFAFPRLVKSRLVEESTSSYRLTDAGNSLASTSGLTKVVPRVD